MTLYLKHKDFVDGQWFEISSDYNAITDRACGIYGLCEEECLMDEVNKNANGFFDFGKSLIDIGSEDGSFAMFTNFSKNYCFEPNRNVCCLIWANMWLKDKVDNTFVYNVFLGDEDKKTMFNGFAGSGMPISNIITDRGFGKEWVEVNVKKLDDYNIENVGLIKIDVEGAEAEVIRGSIDTIIRNNYPPILFESHDVGNWGTTEEQRNELFSLIEGLGYTIMQHYAGTDANHLAVKF